MPNRESSELRWVPEDEVRTLPLHPGFAASWQRLRDRLAAIPLPRSSRQRRAESGGLAPGSSAAVIARTTTTRRRAGLEHLGQPLLVDAADREPRLVGASPAAARTRSRPGRAPARFGRRRPARTDAEIVDLVLGRRAALVGVVGGAADHGPVADDVAGHLQRQVVLAQVQHVGAGRAGDVGAVVDREQRAVPAGRVGQDLERGQLVAGLQRAEPLLTGRTLVAQLDDVDPAGQRGVGELGEVAALAARVGAQVQPGGGQPVERQRSRHVHSARLTGSTLVNEEHGSPGAGLRVG